MFYVAYHCTPVPGKLEEVLSHTERARKSVEPLGVKQIAGFQVSVGAGAGTILWIVSYKDEAAYSAAGKKMEEAGFFKESAAITASMNTAILTPLPGSPIS